jgi:pectinesterase
VDIRVVAAGSEGTITANGRSSSSDPSYYVINKSTIAAASGSSVTAGTFYLGNPPSHQLPAKLDDANPRLGRPWTEYARVVFQYTSMTSVINSAGWIEWSSSSPNTADVLFGEYDNTGSGASGTRASFSEKLSSAIAITTILGSGYTSWVDTSYLS